MSGELVHTDPSASMDEASVKEALRPAKKHLKKLKSGTENLSREEKIVALKECVAGIGNRIDEVVAEKQAEGKNGAKWRKHCWVFASFFWPRQGVNYSKLMDIHKKLVRRLDPYVKEALIPGQRIFTCAHEAQGETEAQV